MTSSIYLNINRRWTKEEEDLLIKLCDDKVPLQKIADTLKRTPNSLITKRHSLRDRLRIPLIKRNTWSFSEAQYLSELVNSGVPWSEIAKILNKTTHSCRAKYARIKGLSQRKLNQPPLKKTEGLWNKSLDEKLVAMWKKGYSFDKISYFLNRSTILCQQRINQLMKKQSQLSDINEYRRYLE